MEELFKMRNALIFPSMVLFCCVSLCAEDDGSSQLLGLWESDHSFFGGGKDECRFMGNRIFECENFPGQEGGGLVIPINGKWSFEDFTLTMTLSDYGRSTFSFKMESINSLSFYVFNDEGEKLVFKRIGH